MTGGTGFIGPAVVRAILDAGHEVRALARSAKGAEKAAALGAEVVEGEMTDAASLRKAVQGVEAVVHLVAIRQGKPEEFRAGHGRRDPRPARGREATPTRSASFS